MKACVIQPPYSNDVSYCDEYFAYKLHQLDALDDSVDLIVLPEYSDVPCATTTLEETLYYHQRYIDPLLNKCVETILTNDYNRISQVVKRWKERNGQYAGSAFSTQ
jgi:predicted amidohydrolase